MEDLKTQILIIGGGASGMAAAAQAAMEKADVIVAEAKNNVGGNGLFPRGIFAVDSYMQKSRLIFCDKDRVYKDCMEYSHWKIDGRIIRALMDKSGETIGWLNEMGVEFCDVVHHIPGQNPEVFHITSSKENAGRVVIGALKEYCEKNNVRILTGAKGVRLILGEDNEVKGAVIERQGREQKIYAQKVILATGGFAGNSEMIREHYPFYDESKVPAGPGIRGEGWGIRLAKEAGAVLDENFTMEIAAPKIQGYIPLNLILGKPYNVWLNIFGRRFADEAVVYNFAQAANACLRQKDKCMWVVFNEKTLNKALSDGRDMIELIHIPFDAEERLDDTIKSAVKDGIMCKADTMEDIGKFIGCDTGAVVSELEEYNDFCKSGRDRIFAKDRGFLMPLDEGPWYVIKAGCDMLITHGGVRVNEEFMALDSEHRPVKNLYVTGVDFGGADADVYNVLMSGHGFGFALNSGRIAALSAVSSME